MARYKENDFTLFPRNLPNSTVWNYYSYDEHGKRLPGKSTGIGFTRERDRVKYRKEAEAYCEQLHEHNALAASGAPTLEQWIEIKRFWDWGRSSYVRGILARSDEDNPGITEGYNGPHSQYQ